jgi:catechol 2,3-dioxygenase-like lactoylglutathione lyase family enzyme
MALQSVSVVTLGVADLERCRRFYGDGFGWIPVFANDEILFYQMNGFVLALWLGDRLANDMNRSAAPPGSMSLAHNVRDQTEVEPLMARLAAHGGTILRPAGAPPHGGFRGYVADPDGHSWEIAYNPAWPIDRQGHVSFSVG